VAQHGQVLKLHGCRSDGKARWAYRYRVDGRSSKRPQVGGFATRDEAERALSRELARLTLAELVEEYLKIHQAAPSTIEKLRWLLSKATAAFGAQSIGELCSEDICAWRGALPEGHRFEATQALRQVLSAAVAWELIDVNPARRGVPNPLRRFPEKLPFESWQQINAVAAELDAVTGPMVVFGAATGLRPAELVALEQRDVDRTGGVVYVRRQLVRGHLKYTKTRRSVRAVPLQAAALEALAQLPRSDGRLLFAARRGGYIDLHNFHARHWRPAQVAAGIDPVRRPYDLRHTYATFALRAGISIFDLSRFMGASLAMIDRHYGHLARGGRDHAVALLDAYARDSAGWTSGGRRRRTPKSPLGESGCSIGSSLTFEAVDVSWTPPLRNVFLGDNESCC
jgi:integrase